MVLNRYDGRKQWWTMVMQKEDVFTKMNMCLRIEKNVTFALDLDIDAFDRMLYFFGIRIALQGVLKYALCLFFQPVS